MVVNDTGLSGFTVVLNSCHAFTTCIVQTCCNWLVPHP
jgi:hypothetical protein